MSYSVAEESFASLKEEWNNLLEASPRPTVFLTFQWQRVSWEEFGQGKELLLLSVRKEGRLVGLAPLKREGSLLSFIGERDLCDYLDFIVASGEEDGFYSGLLDYLSSLPWNTLDLYSLPPHSPTVETFPQRAGERGYQVEVRPEDVCPVVPLPNDWEGYLDQLARKDRHELRRKLRRLWGSEPQYYLTQNGGRLSQDMEDFIRLVRLRGGEKKEFMTPQRARFFQQVAASLAERDHLRLFFLEVKGARVASALCFDYREELSLYNSGYDPAYRSLSVGLLLKALCLKEAIGMGKRRFDFLRGSEPYKYHLGGQDEPIYRCLVRRE